MSLFRVGANLDAMNSIRYLSKINQDLGVRQARLASGKRINTAQDDTAGYAIAKSLESRRGGLSSALTNVQNAKSILAIAEGGFQSQMDLLQTIKSKAVQASDSALSSTQRTAIDNQVTELLTELDDIAAQTKWSGSSMLDGSATGITHFSFHVGGDESEVMRVDIWSSTSSTLSVNTISDATNNATTAMSVGEDEADATITVVDSAIDSLASAIQSIGDSMVRLGKKEDFLTVGVANVEAVRSAYEDADFAVEQMESLKLQILQQTAISSLAQANTAPAVALQLFGK